MRESNFKSVSTKVPRIEYTLILDYCKKKSITPSQFLRDLAKSEIKTAKPSFVSGNNKIEYQKDKDKYNWKIALDTDNTGTLIDIMSNISPSYLEDLNVEITKAIEERNATIKKTKKGSVPVPGGLLKR